MSAFFLSLGVWGPIILSAVPVTVTLAAMVIAKRKGAYHHVLTAAFGLFLFCFLAASLATVASAKGWLFSGSAAPIPGMKLAVPDIPGYLTAKGFVRMTDPEIANACEKGTACTVYWSEQFKTIVIVNGDGTVGITVANFSGTSQEQLVAEVRFARSLLDDIYPAQVADWITGNFRNGFTGDSKQFAQFTVSMRAIRLIGADGSAMDITIRPVADSAK